MKEIHRKGDSLETLRSGIYQGMNTAVILNQSSVLHANEWKGGHHYPIFPSGYHRPVQNLLPIAGLKQLSLGKTDNTWANLNGVYSPQIPMVQVFSPSHVTMKAPMSASVQEQSQRSTQIRMASIANIPQYSPTLTQSITKRTIQSFVPLNPTQFCKTANLLHPKTTAGQRILPSNMPDIINTKTTQGYQQSVIQNVGGYMIQKPSNAINVKPPSSSAVNLTELSPYKENLTTKTAQAKQQELLQTRKRSSSWSPGSGLSKKKPKGGLTKDDQIIEEYKNLEMDVARILIRDIPFPVVSVGDKGFGAETSFVRSGGGQEADRQAEISAVANGGILESEKQGSGSIPRSGGMHVPSRSALESGGKKVPSEHASLWSGGISEFNTQSTVVNGGDTEPEKQETMSRSDGWSGGEPNKEATKSTAGGGALTGSEKQGGTPEATKQTNIYTLASGRVEPEKGENRSNAWSGEMVEPTNQADLSPMGSGESPESNKQAKVSPLWSGGETESEKQVGALNTCSGAMQEPNKQVTKPVQGGVGLEPQKHPSNSGTESRASLHFENEKENYSKNMVTPNKVVFTCEQCIVTFESTQDLISHTASHTSSNFTFKCNVCTQVFRSTNGLQKHIEFHADHRNNFQCSFCFKPFSDRDSLEDHIIESHMSKRPHKCSYCPKAFRDPGSLQKHIRIHTGERPYKCTACEKSFAEYSSLRKHYRVHTGEQPYKCQYCSKAFSISGNLQRHILIHTGERPYKCSECSKTFNNPSHLRRHEKNLHSKLEREK